MKESFEKPPLEEQTEIKEVAFENLERGDQLHIETVEGEATGIFDMTVIGKRKNGLLVKVKERVRGQEKEFTARLPGGFTMHQEKGLTEGIIKLSDEENKNCLYFENLKDVKTKERLASETRTYPIKGIAVIKKEKE